MVWLIEHHFKYFIEKEIDTWCISQLRPNYGSQVMLTSLTHKQTLLSNTCNSLTLNYSKENLLNQHLTKEKIKVVADNYSFIPLVVK